MDNLPYPTGDQRRRLEEGLVDCREKQRIKVVEEKPVILEVNDVMLELLTVPYFELL
jgi:hypothetical protein